MTEKFKYPFCSWVVRKFMLLTILSFIFYSVSINLAFGKGQSTLYGLRSAKN